MKVSSVLLGIALIAISGAAFHFWQELEEERQQNAVLASKSQERQFPTVASPIPTPAQTFTVAGQPLQASTASQLSGNPDRSALIAKTLDAAKMRLASPEGMAFQRSRLRQSQESVYPDVDQALGLTTAEADELLDLLTEQRVRGMQTEAPGDESTQDREARNRKARETEDAEVQALLRSKYPRWQDYRENLHAWKQRSDLRKVLDAAGFPLTQTQNSALINVLTAEQRIINQTRTYTLGQSNGLWGQYTPGNRQRLLDSVTPHLSPQQLDGYKGLLERNAASEQAALDMARSAETFLQRNGK